MAGAPLLLAALVLLANVLPWPGVLAMPGGALPELLLPGVLAEGGQPRADTLVEARPAEGRALAPRAQFGHSLPRTEPGPTAGWVATLLALVALVALRGGPGLWAARAAVLLGVLLVADHDQATRLVPIGRVLLLLGLAHAAACGLASLRRDASRPLGDGACLALGALAVIAAAGLGGLALQAGAVPDREALAPLLERSPAAVPDAGSLAINARYLRVVLDRGALAAFLAMTALLLHLKRRGTATTVLLLVVAAADLLTARWFL